MNLEDDLKENIAKKAVEVYVKRDYEYSSVDRHCLKEAMDGAQRSINYVNKIKSASKHFGESIQLQRIEGNITDDLKKTIRIAKVLDSLIENLDSCGHTLIEFSYSTETDEKKKEAGRARAAYIFDKLRISEGFVKAVIKITNKAEHFEDIIRSLRKSFPEIMAKRRGRDNGIIFNF